MLCTYVYVFIWTFIYVLYFVYSFCVCIVFGLILNILWNLSDFVFREECEIWNRSSNRMFACQWQGLSASKTLLKQMNEQICYTNLSRTANYNWKVYKSIKLAWLFLYCSVIVYFMSHTIQNGSIMTYINQRQPNFCVMLIWSRTVSGGTCSTL